MSSETEKQETTAAPKTEYKIPKKFPWVIPFSCEGCGDCVEACPTGSITLVDLGKKIEGKDLIVIDRDYSFGFGGILANELRAKTCCEPYSVIAGLGGQDVTYDDIAGFVRARKPGEEFWFGVSE